MKEPSVSAGGWARSGKPPLWASPHRPQRFCQDNLTNAGRSAKVARRCRSFPALINGSRADQMCPTSLSGNIFDQMISAGTEVGAKMTSAGTEVGRR
jgi:hypothetical protein